MKGLGYEGGLSSPVLEEPICFSDDGGPMSQESQPELGEADPPVIPPVKKPEAPVRFSDRLSKKPPAPALQKATALLQNKNLEGICQSTNSFSILGNDAIITKAQAMGVLILNDKFACVNVLKELESAREFLATHIFVLDAAVGIEPAVCPPPP